MKCAIVILNYKNYQLTINCIESILKFSDLNTFTVFVVDNCSENDSLLYLRNHFQKKLNVNCLENFTVDTNICLLQNKQNYGYAHGNNIGLKIGHNLGFKYLMVLNNDTLFIQETIQSLCRSLNSLNNALCIGPVLLKNNGIDLDLNCAKRRPTYFDLFRLSFFGRAFKTKKWHKNFYMMNNINSDTLHKVGLISGSCMLFNAEKFNDIGFFDERTFLYYEEAILAEKARNYNLSMFIDTSVKLIHIGASTTKKHQNSVFTVRCEYDSLKLYLKEFRKTPWFISFIVLSSYKLFLTALKIKNK